MTTDKTITNTINHFIQHGYAVVEDCFDPADCDFLLQSALSNSGLCLQDRSSWRRFLEKPVRPGFVNVRSDLAANMESVAPRMWQMLNRLLGSGRIHEPALIESKFEINLERNPGMPWTPPGPKSDSWHLDNWRSVRYLDAGWPNIIAFMLFRDVGPESGGTFICEDSLGPIARRLRDNPQGLNHYGELPDGSTYRFCLDQCTRFRELVGPAGSVVFVNALMLHAPSQNYSGAARVMNRVTVSLKDRLCFKRADGQYSPFEKSVLHALGVESLDYQRQAPQYFLDSAFDDAVPIALPDSSAHPEAYFWPFDLRRSNNATSRTPSEGVRIGDIRVNRQQVLRNTETQLT